MYKARKIETERRKRLLAIAIMEPERLQKYRLETGNSSCFQTIVSNSEKKKE